MDEKVTCPDCSTTSEQSELILKLGGLLCPHCRTILFGTLDNEFTRELTRRKVKEFMDHERKTKNEPK